MTSTTFIQLYLLTGAVMAMFISSDLSHFSAAASVPKGKQNFFIVDSAASSLMVLMHFH
jgi:hypothetical protein